MLLATGHSPQPPWLGDWRCRHLKSQVCPWVVPITRMSCWSSWHKRQEGAPPLCSSTIHRPVVSNGCGMAKGNSCTCSERNPDSDVQLGCHEGLGVTQKCVCVLKRLMQFSQSFLGSLCCMGHRKELVLRALAIPRAFITLRQSFASRRDLLEVSSGDLSAYGLLSPRITQKHAHVQSIGWRTCSPLPKSLYQSHTLGTSKSHPGIRKEEEEEEDEEEEEKNKKKKWWWW